MKRSHLLTVLFLFLLVPASITWAQRVTLSGTVYMEQDYRNVNFSSPQGNIKVILPGNLTSSGSGAVILGGTVTAEPAGKTEKEKQDNLRLLQKMNLLIAGTSIPVAPGSHFFNFSAPAGSTQPVKISCGSKSGNMTELLLKQPGIPAAPSTATLSNTEPGLMMTQKVFLANGNIPVYAVNNTATLFQPTDKFFISDGAGNKAEAIRLSSSPDQAVLAMPAGIQPGRVTVSRQSATRTDQVELRVVSVSLSSPNTNLKKGQTSTCTITIDPKITERDSAEAMQIPIMSLDVRNLTPGVIELGGGNAQVMTFPAIPGSTSPSDWQATRTITGVTPGDFNISAEIYPSSEICNTTVNAQKKALKTSEEFNNWIAGVKKYLQELMENTPNEDKKNQIANALQALPYSSSEEDLELCKTTADIALRGFSIPEFTPASIVAFRAQAGLLSGQSHPGQDLVHMGIIKDGLNCLENLALMSGNQASERKVMEAKEAADHFDRDHSEDNFSNLKNALQKLQSDPTLESMIQHALDQSNLPLNYQKAIIAYLDPDRKQLHVIPEYRSNVLNLLGAQLLANGQYHINSLTPNRKPVAYDIIIIASTPGLLFDATKGFMDMPATGEPKYKKADAEFTDSSGTRCLFYKDAECGKAMFAPWKSETCEPHSKFEWDPDKKDGKLVPDGKYYKHEGFGRRLCEVGKSFCVEMYLLIAVEHIYEDKNCTREVDIVKIYNFTCQ